MEGMVKMINRFNEKTLVNSHYDNGNHSLEFRIDTGTVLGTITVFLNNIGVDYEEHLNILTNEWYWTTEKITEALQEADSSDFDFILN